MYSNYSFSKLKNCVDIISSKYDDSKDIQSFSNFIYSHPHLEEYDAGDYFPQSEEPIEKILNSLFIKNSNDKTNEYSNNINDFFEQYDNFIDDKESSFDINQKEKIQQKIKDDIYLKRPFKEKKLIGRRTKRNEGLGEHNKFTDDNLLRKCKNVVLESLLKFINQKIKDLYSNDSKTALKKRQLFKLSQNQNDSSKVEYYKLFLNKNVKDIFSGDISTKYKRFTCSHNKELIKDLLDENDEPKRIIFEKIFNLSFLECLEYFRGSNFREELLGMNTFDKYCEEKIFGNNAHEYKNILQIFIDNFEKIVINKKSRNKKKKM